MRSQIRRMDEFLRKLERTERVYRNQLGFIEIHRQQSPRWRRGTPSLAQRQEIDRLEIQNRCLR
jgi:hypothetical protein